MAKVIVGLTYEDGNISASVDGKAISIDESAKLLLSKLAFCVSISNDCRLPYALTVMP